MLFFNACTPAWVNRQQDLKNVIWKTEETTENAPALEFLVLQDNGYHFGYIEYNNQKYDIAFVWEESSFWIDHIDYYGQGIKQNTWKTIHGGYEILEDDEVKLEILGDDLFNGALVDKSMTVKATAVDPKAYGAFDRHQVRWQNKNVELEFFVYQCYRRFGVSICDIVGENKILYFIGGKKTALKCSS